MTNHENGDGPVGQAMEERAKEMQRIQALIAVGAIENPRNKKDRSRISDPVSLKRPRVSNPR